MINVYVENNFTFANNLWWNTSDPCQHLYSVTLMQMCEWLTAYLAYDPCQKCQVKDAFSTVEEAVISHFLMKLLSIEQTMQVILVSYKYNVATKHGSSKLFNIDELWLLGLLIKSTWILASKPDALWDMRKIANCLLVESKNRLALHKLSTTYRGCMKLAEAEGFPSWD